MRAGVNTFVLFAGGFAEQDQEGIRIKRASRIYVRVMELCCVFPIHLVMLL